MIVIDGWSQLVNLFMVSGVEHIVIVEQCAPPHAAPAHVVMI